MRSPRTHRLLAGLVLTCATALPSAADAQSVTMSQAAFRFFRPVRRPDGQLPNWISRRDCLEDDPSFGDERPTIRMSPNIQGGRTGWNLQVWVGPGVDCTNEAQRLFPQTQRCTQVANILSPNVAVVDIDISPREVASGVQRPGVLFDPTDPAACDQNFQGALAFYIMLTDAAGTIQGTVAKWDGTSLDLLGPPPPASVRAGVGEDKLIVHWDVPIEGDFEDIDGFALYCDEAGEGDDAAGGCTSDNLVPGQLPPLDFQCGRAGGRATRVARTHFLENGVSYAVAVAGVDRVGNSGELSGLACGTPEPVTSFFEAYREAGGQGGGGFCSWAPPSPPGSFAGLLTATAVWWSRRRRRRA